MLLGVRYFPLTVKPGTIFAPSIGGGYTYAIIDESDSEYESVVDRGYGYEVVRTERESNVYERGLGPFLQASVTIFPARYNERRKNLNWNIQLHYFRYFSDFKKQMLNLRALIIFFLE